MRYADDNQAHLGDQVLIDGKHKGVVVADMDNGRFTKDQPEAQWKHLGSGILIDTDFGGLVHYKEGTDEHIVLVKRAVSGRGDR